MAITITIDNDTSTTGTLEDLILDESGGLQTSGTTDKGNDSNVDITDATTGNPDSNLFDGVLSGFATSFNGFLNAATIFGFGGLRLSDAQKAYAAGVEGAISATDFVKVTTTNNETISDLYFSDSSGAALNGDQVVGMQTLDGSNVYLWSDGDYCIATTSATAGAGRVVAAFYLKDDAGDHKSAQIQMVTFEPLKHPDAASPDDALNFTDVMQVSAAGTVSFNFDNLNSGSFLWAAVGSGSVGLLVTGQDLNVIDGGAKNGEIVKGGGDPSDSVNTSQGGIGATIGINSQHFADQSGQGGTKINGPVGVFTLVNGFVPLQNAAQATGIDVDQIDYANYVNAPSAKIFISQSTGGSQIGASMKISLYEAGGGDGGVADHLTSALTPEEGYGTGRNAYIGNDDTDQNVKDDWPVAVGSVTVLRGNTLFTFTGTGGTQGGITVAISGNSITLSGIQTADTIGFTAADTASPLDGTFNRIDVQCLANSNPFDIGRIDLDQGVSISAGVGGSLIVEDDGPTPGTDFVRHVDEDALTGAPGSDLSVGNIDNPDDGDGIAGEQDEVSFTQADLSVLINSGTDKPASLSLNTSLAAGTAVTTTTGANVFSNGVQVFWRVSGGALEGVTDAGTGSERVIFRITVDTQGNADPSDDVFTFDLKDQLDHANAAGELANLLLNITPAFRGTDADLDPVNFGTTKIVMQVENDTPVLDGDTVSKHVDEDAMTGAAGGDLSTGNIDAAPDGDGIAGEQDEATFTQANLQGIVAAGADDPVLFSLNLSLSNGTAVKTVTGDNVFSKGVQVFWRVVGGVVQGVTDAGTGNERIIFTLTKNDNALIGNPSDDTFTFDLKDQLDHANAAGELALITLNVTPAFSGQDFDGDAVDLSNSNAIRVDVENDTAALDGDTVSKHVDEDAMTGAGGGDLSTGNIDAAPDGDGIAGEQDEASFSQADLQSILGAGADEPVYFSLNLSLANGTAVKSSGGANVFSNGDQVFWRVTGSVVEGVTDAGTADERVIFTITRNDNALVGDPSDDTFTFDLKDQLDHSNASGELGLLTLNVTPAFSATDFDGDAVDLSNANAIRVDVENDTPAPDGDTVTKHVDEDAMTGAGGGDLSTGIIETPADSDGIAGEQDEASFSQADLQGVVSTGADELVFFSLNAALSNGTAVKTAGGANVTSKGVQVFWRVSGGVIQGVTDAGTGNERIIFTITKNDNALIGDPSDDTFTFDLKDQLDHGNGAGELSLLTLNVTPAFLATDHDGDPVNFGTAAPILVEVENDIPTFTAQIEDGEVAFKADATGTVTKSLNGAIGADDTNATNTSQTPSIKQYTITSWTEPHNVFPDLDGVLSADGTKVTYYSTSVTANQNATTAVYELSLNQTANTGAGSYTFTVLKAPPIVQQNFDFTDLPSGQNLMGVIATDKADLTKGGLLVLPSNPVLFADGTMTNTSGTVNTSKGGGPVTIGNANQAFDNPAEGAFFCYVDNPLASSVGGLGLTQVTADDADTVKFNGTNEATRASVEIVQASGAGTAKRPGPALQITAYDINPGNVNTDAASKAFVLDPTATDEQVKIISVKILDSLGNVVEFRTNNDAGATNGGTLAGGSSDSPVGISFVLDNPNAAGTADDDYSVLVSNLKQGYTVEFVTDTGHDLAKVQNVSGSYDIGGFNVFNSVNVPAQDFDFSVQVNDYDNDAYGGTGVPFANFSVTIDSVIF